MYTHLDVTTSTATCWPCTNLAHKSRILGLPLVQTSQAPRQTLPRRWVSRCVLLHRTWLAPWHQTAPGIAPTVSGSPSWLNKKKDNGFSFKGLLLNLFLFSLHLRSDLFFSNLPRYSPHYSHSLMVVLWRPNFLKSDLENINIPNEF